MEQQRRIALLDADSIIYILAWNNREHKDEASMYLQLDQFMVDLITATEATHYLGAFSDRTNFRYGLYPEYKANRRKTEVPEHLLFWKPRIIDRCISEYQFIVAPNLEADDVLSIMRGDNVVYCSPDKDLKQIPGLHYDYRTGKFETITEQEANYRFWTQMLTGDSTDNIPGCKGIGPVKAEKIISPEMTNLEMANAVLKAYKTNTKYANDMEAGRANVLMYRLLKLRSPSFDAVTALGRHIIEVGYRETELNTETDGVLQSDQRSHADDLLRPPVDNVE